jgi:molecular chaperone GrpE (heat shock protein)
MLSEQLKQIIDREEQYEAAKRSALQTLKKGFRLGGKITWKREDLYER